MDILISSSIFENPVDKRDFRYLLNQFDYLQERYRPFLEKMPDDEFMNNLEATDRLLLTLAYNDFANTYQPIETTVEFNGEQYDAEKIFSIKEMIAYMVEPISVMVENSLNDAYFLEALFQNFDRSGRLSSFYKNHWLIFDNGGGASNMKNALKAKLKQFGNKSKFLKTFILIDGDRRYPSHKVEKYNDLIQFADQNGISYHILEKRCMENYLPMDALPNQYSTWQNAFAHLSEEQKDFINIGGGFFEDLSVADRNKVLELEKINTPQKKGRPKSNIRNLLPVEVQEFYQDVSEGNFIILEKGLKGHKFPNFKNSFPELFQHYSVTKETLLDRTKHQQEKEELQNITNTILSLT